MRNLTFQYSLSDRNALNGVNLDVEEGSFTVIIGSSGCGKTTFLRHIKRELRPAGITGGKILFKGRDINALSAIESTQNIGMVMQNPESQIVTDEVWHELAFGLENMGLDNGTIRRRVAEMAGFFGIGSWFHKKTSELSGGQKQLLNLASVLCMQPRLLLLDEPTSQLDPVASRDFITMCARLNHELGITVVMTEHRLEEVLPYADTCGVLENGRFLYIGRPRSLAGAFAGKGGAGYMEWLPAASRVYAETGGEGDSPLTVREGREWLKSHAVKIRDTDHAENQAKDTPKAGAAVEFRDVWFRYGKEEPDILRGLCFEARYGELLCIMGENGSGKSTVLGIAAGLLRPQRGRVTIAGKPLGRYRNSELYSGNLALLPQNPKALFVCDTVGEDLNGYKIQEAHVHGVEHLLGRHPYDLSGGELQKAALSRVLMQKPRILLLDEPTKGLDPDARADFAAFVGSFTNKGGCAVMITHDVEFAAENAGRCLLLFDGEGAGSGRPRDFFGGNCFYTTAANRIARDFDPNAITCRDVVSLCKN